MAIVRKLIDYTLEHGTSPAAFAWPHFPYTTTRHGDLEFKGFTPTFALHETHVDHAGDIGLTYYRLYQFTGDEKYRTAAIHVADVLAANARTGTATHSVWPYRVRMDTGEITAQYGANWIGCYALLDELVRAGLGNTKAYAAARAKARDFILQHPMQTGYWTDGHSDNAVNSHTYRSNLSKSNALLYIFDHPEFDPDWRTNVPKYIKWTEDYFVHRTSGGEPATAFGANVVGEQDGFNFKMDYQTARYAAECARWYRVSGDESYREKAYRSLNWVTYCSDADGRATESPYSLNIASWWSDCYGECPRMFYQAFAAMPEWAPPREDHILYSYGVLADVSYGAREVRYTARDAQGTEYLRLSYLPTEVTLNGTSLPRQPDSTADGWTSRELGGGDYAVTIQHSRRGEVRSDPLPPQSESGWYQEILDLEKLMKRSLNLAWQFPFWLAALAVIPSASPAAETVLLEQPQLAGISGFREFWDTPVVLADGGLVVETVHTPGGTGPTAVWSPAKRDGGAKPGAIAFDAVHRSLLVRFPGAAEKIAAKLVQGLAVQKAELILPFRATELWPEGYLEPAGMSFLGDAWAKDSPRWHAVAYALRKPWFADAQRGPTFNAAHQRPVVLGQVRAQDLQQDRYERQFGPAEVSAANAVGRLDVTAALNDPAFGATVAERLRQFEDCGFVVRKWEVYDARLWQGGYEWATATGPRGILIGSPKLEVTLAPATTREKSACRLPAAPELSKLSGGMPTAVLPSAEQIGKLAARLKFQRPQWMPDWQWQRVQEVHQLGGAGQFPATLEAYHQWLDEQLGYAPRRWSGFDATERAQDYFKYYDALPEPVRDHWKLYWWAWLMPDRSFPEFERDGKKYQFAQGYIGGKEAQAYYAQTGDWRGNFSVYRTYCWTMGTMNFNHWAVAGTLLGGQIMDSEQCLADGRQGLEQWPLRTWCWFDGSTQESIDHYYFAHSLTAQKVFADFGPAALDRMMGQSIMAKSIEELTSSYHPGLRRFISSSGRTGIGYVLGIQDGLQHILHTLSREGAYTDFGRESITAPNVEKLPAIGHDYRPGQAAEQSLNGPWAPEWMAQMVDAKPLPYESTVTYKMWGGYSQTPLLKRSYLGQHYGLASLDVSVGNETVPVMAQWRRTDKKAASLTDLGTLLIRPGLNRTELLDSIYHDTQQRNPNGSVGTQGSHLVTLQHRTRLWCSPVLSRNCSTRAAGLCRTRSPACRRPSACSTSRTSPTGSCTWTAGA